MPALFVFLPDIINIITIRIYCTVTAKDIKLDAIKLWLYTAVIKPAPLILYSRRKLYSRKLKLTLPKHYKAHHQGIAHLQAHV